jgi:hypothetical protein
VVVPEDSVVDLEDQAVDPLAASEAPSPYWVVDLEDRAVAPEDQEATPGDREGQAGSVRGCLSLQP